MLLPEHLAKLATLRIGTSPTVLRVLDGPFVTYTDFGYIPVLHVKVEKSNIEYLLSISARSLARALNQISKNDSSFAGLQLSIKKESDEKTSKYEVTLA